jgi:tetratricopeptide (TPR) repeat protein
MNYHFRFLFFITFTSLYADELLECNTFEINTDTAITTARTFVERGEYHKAIPYFEQALQAHPDNVQFLFEYANALNTINNTQKALDIYLQLLKYRPTDSAILYNTAYTFKKLGHLDQAMPYYEKTLQQNPQHAEAHFSLGLALLMKGDFDRGWQEYEWRWKRNTQLMPRNFNKPLWDGSSLHGKTILIHAEQGLGDTFQFIRYVKIVKEQYHGTVLVAVQRPLFDIISRCCPYIDQVTTLDHIPSTFDVHIPLMSLPLILKTKEDTIPHDIPYIIPDQTLIASWEKKLAQDTSFKVGLCWQGNSNYSTLFLRAVVAAKSINVNMFAPLSTIPGVTFYSLQKETGMDQLATLHENFKLITFDEDFDKNNGRFMDTAAVMKNLDLIITVDTSIAHLTGALGVPVWVMLPEPADWRWMLNRSDSPWYPCNMRLFRQSASGDWETVIKTMTYELQKLVTQKKSPCTLFETKLQNHPDAQTHYEYGTYLASLDMPEQYEKAWYHLKQAIILNPLQHDWLFAFGTFCCRIGKFHDALNAYRTILVQKPSYIPVLYNSGYTLKTAGQLDAAIGIYKKITELKPDYEPAHLALAFALLNQGNFQDGWREHEWNLKKQGKDSPAFRALLQNNAIAGKKIILIPEGGLGDTIQFIRYAQRLHDMGAYVIAVVQQPLKPLLSLCPFIDELLIPQQLPAADATATLMSLPALFGDTEHSLPRTIPYIFLPQERIDYWQQQLQCDTNIKIGICWQPDVHNDISRLPIARRGIPLKKLCDIGLIDGVTLYSLQQKEGLDQLKNIPATINLHIFDSSFDVSHGNFIDTAAVMHNLDLIITTDTAVAHLAGAMGKKVWLLLPYATDWRWLHNRTDSPWYPTMRIFKQPVPFDWDTVMQEVKETLKKEFYSHPSTSSGRTE